MKGSDWTILALAVVLAVFVGALAFSSNTVSEKVVIQERVQVVQVAVADNTTQEIRDKLFENDDFEAFALALAKEELADDDYEDLFDFMVDENIKITDIDDISRVVIKEDDVSDVDVDEGNAEVELEFRVYFENEDGEDVREDVVALFTIEDEDVEEVEFELA